MDIVVEPCPLTVNGDVLVLAAPVSVAGLVAELQLDVRKVAVELNREIVPRSGYESTMLRARDHVEIVHFIGGG